MAAKTLQRAGAVARAAYVLLRTQRTEHDRTTATTTTTEEQCSFERDDKNGARWAATGARIGGNEFMGSPRRHGVNVSTMAASAVIFISHVRVRVHTFHGRGSGRETTGRHAGSADHGAVLELAANSGHDCMMTSS
jgi:hypothetical protein